MNKITRRQAAAIALSSATVMGANASAQTAPDLLQAARDSKRTAAESLARFELPISVEPAFQFKA